MVNLVLFSLVAWIRLPGFLGVGCHDTIGIPGLAYKREGKANVLYLGPLWSSSLWVGWNGTCQMVLLLTCVQIPGHRKPSFGIGKDASLSRFLLLYRDLRRSAQYLHLSVILLHPMHNVEP